MTRNILVCASALGLLSAPAIAAEKAPKASPVKSGPKLMSDSDMDKVVAGVDVVTNTGRLVWTVTNLTPPEGYNPGGKGNTASASGGLLRAVEAGGLSLAN